jgi:ABC-2 type transport system ATP-binding protein/ribosome-dependent ATPase
MAVIAAGRDLVRRFGDFTAVDRVSLEIARREVVGLLGANGAGKTTFIRLLLGLIDPSQGTVELFGQAPSRQSLRRVGYVPQGLGLYTDLTVTENLAFQAGLFGVEVPRPGADLAWAADVQVGELPLGIQRRVAFLAALAHRPDLLVLDEPTSGVGALGRARLWDTIRLAAEEGAGVLVTTHHMEEAEQCDRLVMMADGRKVAEGSVDEVVGKSSAAEVEAREWAKALLVLEGAGWPVKLAGRRLRVPGVAPTRVEETLSAAGIEARVEERPSTLDETFVALTRS